MGVEKIYNILFPTDLIIVILWLIFELKTQFLVRLFKKEIGLFEKIPNIDLLLLFWSFVSLIFGFLFIYFSVCGLLRSFDGFDILGYFPILGPILVGEGLILFCKKIGVNFESQKRIVGFLIIFSIISITVWQCVYLILLYKSN